MKLSNLLKHFFHKSTFRPAGTAAWLTLFGCSVEGSHIELDIRRTKQLWPAESRSTLATGDKRFTCFVILFTISGASRKVNKPAGILHCTQWKINTRDWRKFLFYSVTKGTHLCTIKQKETSFLTRECDSNERVIEVSGGSNSLDHSFHVC